MSCEGEAKRLLKAGYTIRRVRLMMDAAGMQPLSDSALVRIRMSIDEDVTTLVGESNGPAKSNEEYREQIADELGLA